MHIHEAMGESQEALHNIKSRNQATFVLKIDLSKSYNMYSWTFLQLLLHIGFSFKATKWIMSCVASSQFAILINGVASNFFSST